MTVVAPNKKLSTSSESTPSITPTRLRYASSASASPGAWICQRIIPNTSRKSAHHPPLKPKRLYDIFHARYKFMAGLVDLFPPLNIRPLRSIKDKNRKKRRVHECGTSEKKRSKNRVFALFSVLRMEKPDASIDSETKPAFPVGIGFKAFLDRQFCQRAGFRSRPKKLNRILQLEQKVLKRERERRTSQRPATPIQ